MLIWATQYLRVRNSMVLSKARRVPPSPAHSGLCACPVLCYPGSLPLRFFLTLPDTVVAVSLDEAALPFRRSSLVWRNITYSVTVPDGKATVEKVLLSSVSGAAVPGKIVALMGATGGNAVPLLLF